MNRILLLVSALALAASALVAGATAAQSTGGRIAIQSNRSGSNDIVVMNPDGTGRVELTSGSADDQTPRWSPDGTRLAFASNRDGDFEIFTMAADGSDLRQVTSNTANDRWPDWTGDGKLVVQRGTFGNRTLYLVDPAGGEKLLTPDGVDSSYPAPAPRAPWVAFSRTTTETGQRLMLLNTETLAQKPAVPGPADLFDVHASWSPTGNDLVFVRGNDQGTDLYVAHKDGTGLRALAATQGRIELQPSFSPDGRSVVFNACSGGGTPAEHCAAYSIRIDGTGERELSTPIAPYADTFDGPDGAHFWTTFGAGDGPTATRANGRLELVVPTDTTLGASGYATTNALMRCWFPGDFDIRVSYQLLSGELPGGTHPGFSATEFTAGSFSGSHGLFRHNSGSPGVSTFFSPPDVFVPDASLTGSLRLVRSTQGGQTTISAYRLESGSWQHMLTETAPTNDGSAANLYAFTNQVPTSEVRLAFDDFQIASGEVRCPSSWNDTAPDWRS